MKQSIAVLPMLMSANKFLVILNKWGGPICSDLIEVEIHR